MKQICYQKQKGLSLLEVLIALVLLAVGLLGIAGLQITGIRYAHNASLRYQAMLQVVDMADRMRANQLGLDAGSYNNISGTGSDPNCISSGCTPAQMAQTDRFEWNTTNARTLPSGAGTIVNNGNRFTITVSWREMEGALTNPTAQQVQLVFEP